MSVNILGLGNTEATLIRPDTTNQTYKMSSDKIKEDLEKAKTEGSHDLLELSGVSKEKMESMQNLQRTSAADYSVDAFFRKDMPKLSTGDGRYSVGGTTFSKEELEQARTVMQGVLKESTVGLGRGGTLDYKDYASMAAAENIVNKYASENFSKEQQDVIAKAMKEYTKGVEDAQNDILGDGTYVESNYGKISDYYGLTQVMDENMANSMNKLKQELSRVTGKTYKESKAGDLSGVVQCATNKKMIQNVRSLFENADLSGDTSAVMKKYNSYMKQVWAASEPSEKDTDRIVSSEGKEFADMLERMKRAASYHSMDFTV